MIILMMRTTRLKNPVAAIAVLALTASTVLRFHSRRKAVETVALGPFVSRRLTHQSTDQYGSGRAYERTRREVIRMGYQPGTAKFAMHLEDRIRRKQMRGRLRKSNEMKQRKEVRPMREILIRDRKLRRESLSNSKEVWLRGFHPKSTWFRDKEVKDAEEMAGEIEEKHRIETLEDGYEPLTVCGRPADVGSTEDVATLQKYSQCLEITQDRPILMLEGTQPFGRTGNNLIEFLHAIQAARDFDIQLGIKARSWAMDLITKMWMAIEGDDWVAHFERTFCVKVFLNEAQLKGWDIIHQSTKELFNYKSDVHLSEYMKSQEYSVRTLFRNYNTGEGVGITGHPVLDMCSGINAILGDDRGSAIYSAIHSRSLEGQPGFRLLSGVARKSGCDPVAALEMSPEYIKAILGPLGMTNYPIAFITDGQNPGVLSRLMEDPEIGPLMRVVPEEASWIGGDLTLAIMSNVFIGNPASTFTGFIAKTRLALGFGHNHLFRAKDERGQWKTVCGDFCIFDQSIMGVAA